MPQVELYIKTSCPYCIRARQLLASKGVQTKEHVVDHGGPTREEMLRRAGGRMTVPQIFIAGQHIGGWDEMFRLDRAGRLDELLAG